MDDPDTRMMTVVIMLMEVIISITGMIQSSIEISSACVATPEQ